MNSEAPEEAVPAGNRGRRTAVLVEDSGRIAVLFDDVPIATAAGATEDGPWRLRKPGAEPRDVDGRAWARVILDEVRVEWQRLEGSLYRPTDGECDESGYVDTAPPGVCCVVCGTDLSGQYATATVWLRGREPQRRALRSTLVPSPRPSRCHALRRARTGLTTSVLHSPSPLSGEPLVTDELTTTICPTTVDVLARSSASSEARRVTVVAEPTDTPGLVITPGISRHGFDGSWALTHAPTGYQIPVPAWNKADLDDLRVMAKALGDTPVNWTGDFETVRAQVAEHSDAVNAARLAARYPIPAPDGPDDTTGEGPAPIPNSPAQATADATARHLTVSANLRSAATWKLIKREDPDGRELYLQNIAALVTEWALILLLRAFADVDQRAADHYAREIWNGWNAGDSIHEEVWEWAREYGLPEVKDERDAVPTSAPPGSLG